MKNVVIYICFLVYTNGAELEQEFEARKENIVNTLKEIKTEVQNSYTILLYKEINDIQELVSNINSELNGIERMINSQSHHEPLMISEAEASSKTSEKIIEKLALLDTKLINIDDREILDKIEEYVLKMDDYDNFLRKSSRNYKETIEKLYKHIKNDHRHYWLVVLTALSSIFLLISLKIIRK